MPVQVCYCLPTLMAVTIHQNWEQRQNLLFLSLSALQNTGLEYIEEEQVWKWRVCDTSLGGYRCPWGGHHFRPRTHSCPQSLTPGILLKRFKTWGKSNYTHTPPHTHTNTQYLHLKFLFCEMAWEKLACRFPVGLGISHYYSVYCSPVGLSV